MVIKTSFLGAALLVTTFGLAAPAQAQSCAADSDCPQSYSCVASDVTIEPATICPSGADCAKPDLDASVKGTTIRSCQPKTCSADPECGAGMVCETRVGGSCSGGGSAAACAPNTVCDASVPTKTEPTCTTTTTKQCAFKWQAPCRAAADCGDGFTCEPIVLISCSFSGTAGTGGTASSGSGSTSSTGNTSSTGSGGASAAPDKPAAPDAGVHADPSPTPSDAATPPVLLDGGTTSSCTTTSYFPGYCQPKVTTCAADTDCPAAWKCTAAPTPVSGGTTTSMGRAASAPAATGGADGTADGGVKTCVSPLGYAYPTRGETTAGGAPQAGGTGASTGDAGGTLSTSGGATGGGGTTGGGGATGGATRPAANYASSSSSGGCSFASGGVEPTGLMLLALLALRRKKR